MLEREELWMVVIKAQAPHLLQMYRLLQHQQQQQQQQQQGQEAKGGNAAVPTYQGLFRSWLEIDEWPDEEEARMERWHARFEGCFLMLSVFSDEEIPKLVGSLSIDLQDEDLLYEFLDGGLRMEEEDGDPHFFDLKHVWADGENEAVEEDEEDEENELDDRIPRSMTMREWEKQERRIKAKGDSIGMVMYLVDSKQGRMCRLASFCYEDLPDWSINEGVQPFCRIELDTLPNVVPRVLVESQFYCYIRFVWPLLFYNKRT